MADKHFFAPLVPGQPQQGMGLYRHGTGELVYYSDGGAWFFELTGKPKLYLSEGRFYWRDGTLFEDLG